MASENFKEVRDSCSRLVGDTKSDQMLFIITEGFNIYPENKNDSESDESYLANHAMNISLMNVTSKLNILAHLYQWREQIALQVYKIHICCSASAHEKSDNERSICSLLGFKAAVCRSSELGTVYENFR
jgi:hypothetical protein